MHAYLGIYSYTFMHITTLNVKIGHEFKREPEKVYGMIWREEREGRNDVIFVTSKDKISHYPKRILAAFTKGLHLIPSTHTGNS